MSARLLISARPGETRAALVRCGRMVWYDFIRTLHDGTPPLPVGTVCLARVRKVEPGLQAAFVDMGGEESALLRAKDARRPHTDDDTATPIERLVHEGAAILVQISRAGRDGKGPRVTHDLALPAPGGKIVHPLRGGKTPLWAQIQKQARAATAPAVIWRPPPVDPAISLWRNAPAGVDVIEVDHAPSAAVLRRALAEAGACSDVVVSRNDVFAAHELDEQVDGLLTSFVQLTGGGSLVIEPAAALTAIDVNAGSALGSTTEDTALKVNLDAAAEIPRQIALRSLAGIIVIDFLRLKAARHRRRVIEALELALKTFDSNASVTGFSPAGLVELVMPRLGTPLHERLASPCPRCAGVGLVPTVSQHALALLARVAREARRGNSPLEAHAAIEVIDWLDAHATDVARELERFAITAVSWTAESDWPPGLTDIRPARTRNPEHQDRHPRNKK